MKKFFVYRFVLYLRILIKETTHGSNYLFLLLIFREFFMKYDSINILPFN